MLSARQSKPIVHRHSPMRKIIISPYNYAARIICNPLPSSPEYCFPTRSIEMAFDRASRRDRIKISGPLSQIRCSPLPTICNILGNSSRLRTQDRANLSATIFLTEKRWSALVPWRIYFHVRTIIIDTIRQVLGLMAQISLDTNVNPKSLAYLGI